MHPNPDIPQPDPIVYDTPSDFGHSPEHEPMDESHPNESNPLRPDDDPLKT